MGEFKAGDRVWYEPAEGLRFAGVVEGPGSIEKTLRVHLTHHYWRWKNTTGPHGILIGGDRAAPAIDPRFLRYSNTHDALLEAQKEIEGLQAECRSEWRNNEELIATKNELQGELRTIKTCPSVALGWAGRWCGVGCARFGRRRLDGAGAKQGGAVMAATVYERDQRDKKNEARIRALKEVLIEVDRLLQDDFGGFYESAPASEPLGRVREMLRSGEVRRG